MLTQLSTLKSRLGILETDPQFDTLLMNALLAVGARFDKECRRRLVRTENFSQEFPPTDREIVAQCYPIETVTKFELKSDETTGWAEQIPPQYVVRERCIISLASPLSTINRNLCVARMTYTGGYLLPGDTPSPPAPLATPLPADLEQAAVEQIAFWFQNRDRLGLLRVWEYHGIYRQFADADLLTSVKDVLAQYTRWG